MKGRRFQRRFSKKKHFSLENFFREHVRLIFFLYLLVVIKVIIFKYPLEQLRAIAATWEKAVILE